MKHFFIFLLLAGCNRSSNIYPVANVTPSTAKTDAASKDGSSPQIESFDIISKLLNKEISNATYFLGIADEMSYKEFEFGTEIELKDCLAIALDVCPSEQNSIRIYINKVQIKNSQGVAAIAVLSLKSENGLKQFLLDSQDKVVEHSEAVEKYQSISSLTQTGDEISKIQNASLDSKEPLRLKSQSSYTPKSEQTAQATRVQQNDGNGNNLVITSVRAKSQVGVEGASVRIIENSQVTCSYGSILSTHREFGDRQCEEKMKITTTLF